MKLASIIKNKHYCVGKTQDGYVLYKYASGILSDTLIIERSSDLKKLQDQLRSIVAYIENEEKDFTITIGLHPEVDVEKTIETLKSNDIGTNHRKSGIQKITFTFKGTDKTKLKLQIEDICKKLHLNVYAVAAY